MSLALYRKYRPATFAEVVGQEHVTEPLQQALRTGRVHHAYLFSGPRGCGKTSSARILARSLNCEQGPTPTPCGTCDSCVALAPNGPGSIDVVEIDAATHGLVDDARELREKAVYAPAQSQFRVYIIDEAHQLGPGAANALLKIIEEPPPYLKFIFATTEPEKIIGTIRSRTHHYPFRLVPPGVLTTHLAAICESEGVAVADGVLPLVVRAGAGSVRDSLSVLDQLIAATGDEGITYPLATALLGFTPAALLDQTVDAVAARDGAALFATVDRVVEGGVDPRRYAGDLLERWRDLMVISQIPDAVEQDLLHHPPDTLELMAAQAGRFSFAELTRAADVTAAALNELKGATSPRLQLEILVARLMLTAADSSDLGIVARLAQVERLAAAGAFAGPVPVPVPEPVVVPESGASGQVGAEPAGERAPAPTTPVADPEAAPSVVAAVDGEAGPADPEQPARLPGPEAAPSAGAGGTQLQRVRVLWADVLEAVKNRSRVSWMMLFEKAQVLDLDGSVLTLALGKPGDVKAFNDGGHGERVRQALIDVAGMDLTVQAVLNPSAAAAGTGGGAPRGGGASGGGRSSAGARRAEAGGSEEAAASGGTSSPARATAVAAAPAAPTEDPGFGDEPDPDDEVESTDPAAVLRALGATPISE